MSSDESTMTFNKNGDQIWRNAKGEIHRIGGPSHVFKNGTLWWSRNGTLFNDEGPTIIRSNGEMLWKKDGSPSTEEEVMGITCTVDSRGGRHWKNKEGMWHRVHGPAYVSADGKTQQWRRNHKLHRVGGPAYICDGFESYYLDDKLVTKEQAMASATSVGTEAFVTSWSEEAEKQELHDLKLQIIANNPSGTMVSIPEPISAVPEIQDDEKTYDAGKLDGYEEAYQNHKEHTVKKKKRKRSLALALLSTILALDATEVVKTVGYVWEQAGVRKPSHGDGYQVFANYVKSKDAWGKVKGRETDPAYHDRMREFSQVRHQFLEGLKTISSESPELQKISVTTAEKVGDR